MPITPNITITQATTGGIIYINGTGYVREQLQALRQIPSSGQMEIVIGSDFYESVWNNFLVNAVAPVSLANLVALLDPIFLKATSGGGGGGVADPNSAATLGILANGADQTANMNAAFASATVTRIKMDAANAKNYVISGTVNGQGKTLHFEKDNVITGIGTLNNVILSIPSIKQKVFAKTLTVNAIGTTTGKISVMAYGATDDGATDSADEIQKCISDAVNNKKISTVVIPGNFFISYGIEILRSNGAGDYQNVVITIEGDQNAFDITKGQGSQIILGSKTDFAFGIMLGKGVSIKNIDFYGQNTGLRSFTIRDVNDPATVWETNATAERTQSPHCAIAIDCYGSAAVAAGGQGYAGRSAKYIHAGGSGSTDVKISNCGIKDFNCGIAVSPAGTTQNGEGIVAERIFFSGCTDCFAVGNSQTRTCVLRDSYAWIGIKHVLNGIYGQGISALPQIQGFLNIAGGVKWLFKASNNRQAVYLENVYAELLYGIGGNFGGINCDVTLKNCFIDLCGSVPIAGNTAKQPMTILRCTSVVFIGGALRHYGVPSYPLQIRTLNATPPVFIGTQLDRTLITECSYSNCPIPSNSGVLADNKNDLRFLRVDNSNSIPIYTPFQKKSIVLYDNLIERVIDIASPIVSSAIAAIITLDLAAGTISFLVPTANLKTFKVGSKIQMVSNAVDDDFNSYGGGYASIPLANIASLTPTGGGSTALINGIPNGLLTATSYTIYALEDKVARATHLGTIMNFSDQITGVIKEGANAAIMLSVGDIIKHKNYPIGTYITNIAGTTITMSDTSQSASNDLVCFTTYEYKQICSNANTINFGGVQTAFKVGDEVFNTSTDTTFTKWVCIQDGITQTASLPVFKKVLLT